jgi:hypothetical protein
MATFELILAMLLGAVLLNAIASRIDFAAPSEPAPGDASFESEQASNTAKRTWRHGRVTGRGSEGQERTPSICDELPPSRSSSRRNGSSHSHQPVRRSRELCQRNR